MALTTGAGWGAAVQSVTTAAAQTIALSGLSKVAILKNPSTATVTVYLGGADLTTANAATDGFPLAPGESLALGTESRGDALSQPLHVVTAAGTGSLVILGGGS